MIYDIKLGLINSYMSPPTVRLVPECSKSKRLCNNLDDKSYTVSWYFRLVSLRFL